MSVATRLKRPGMFLSHCRFCTLSAGLSGLGFGSDRIGATDVPVLFAGTVRRRRFLCCFFLDDRDIVLGLNSNCYERFVESDARGPPICSLSPEQSRSLLFRAGS